MFCASGCSILAILIGTVNEIAGIIGTFRDHLIAWLGSASNGIVDLFAKNLHAENVYAGHGFFNQLTASSTVTEQLCVGKVCITESEFLSVFGQGALSGSVLGASTHADAPEEETASAPVGGGTAGAPARLPASGENAADAATTTMEITEASSTPMLLSPLSPSNDEDPVLKESASGTDVDDVADQEVAEEPPAPTVAAEPVHEPANGPALDGAEQLPATGTD